MWEQRRQAAMQWWASTTPAMQMFACGCGTMLFTTIVMLTFGAGPLVNGFGIAGLLFVAAGFVVDCYGIAMRLWELPIGKLVGACVATMIAAAAMAIAGGVFNSATGLEPDKFAYAVAFIAPLTAGFLIAYGSVIVGIGVVAWGGVHAMWGFLLTQLGGEAYDNRYDLDKFVIRVFGVLALWLANSAVLQIGGLLYVEGLGATARGFTFFFEMYPYDRCAGPGERVRRLSDERIAVGRRDGAGFVFYERRCDVYAGAPES